MKPPPLPRLVWTLGAVSFATDCGAEMIVPLLPALLASLGGTMLHLGLLQGASDLAVAALKVASGRLSDRQRRRRPWILCGYTLSALLRPLFALVDTPLQALLVRVGDRVGKGLRAAPRDALLTAAVATEQRGHAFGVQRALDHAGALAGAALASGLLFAGIGLRQVFALSLLPGLVAMAAILGWVFDVEQAPSAAPPRARAAWPAGFPRVLAAVALSAISGTADLFALALAQRLGTPVAALPLLWIVLHTTRALLAAPLGRHSDRLGRRRLLVLGLLLHGLVLAAFAVADAAAWMWPLFGALGLHAACTEGAERSLVADFTGADRRGALFGVYHAVQGLAAFGGALLLGWSWDRFGPGASFAIAAAAAMAGAGVASTLRR